MPRDGGRACGAASDYFPRLLAGEDVLGSLIISRSTGHRSIVVATPIIENQHIVGAIGVSIRTRLISQLVDQHSRFPENLYFYALARDQQIAIHRHPDKLFKKISLRPGRHLTKNLADLQSGPSQKLPDHQSLLAFSLQ